MSEPESVDIYAYLDYRQFLDAHYRARKAVDKKFSHRFIGREGRFDPGLFSKIVKGKRDISLSMIFKLAAILKLDKRQAGYFESLVLFNQAPSHLERKHYFEKLMTLRKTEVKPVEIHQYEFYSKWYYSALRDLLSIHDDPDPERLASMLVPPIKPAEARAGVELLQQLGFVETTPAGRFKVKNALITTGYGNADLQANNFILENLDLAKGAIDRFRAEVRNLSTITFSIPRSRYKHYEERIRAFRRELMKEIEKEPGADSVYQLNMQLFPLTKDVGRHA
jgi:uncharacterized protein (TIGR02147 family)